MSERTDLQNPSQSAFECQGKTFRLVLYCLAIDRTLVIRRLVRLLLTQIFTLRLVMVLIDFEDPIRDNV